MSLILTSADFPPGGPIPAIHTCDGANISPALSWSGVPPDARSLVLIIDDPDAPDPAAPKMTWVHWVLYNLPPQANHLAAGIREADLPKGTPGERAVGLAGRRPRWTISAPPLPTSTAVPCGIPPAIWCSPRATPPAAP